MKKLLLSFLLFVSFLCKAQQSIIVGPQGDCDTKGIRKNEHASSKWFDVSGVAKLKITTLQHRTFDKSRIYNKSGNLIWEWGGESFNDTWYEKVHIVAIKENKIRVEFYQGYSDPFCNGSIKVEKEDKENSSTASSNEQNTFTWGTAPYAGGGEYVGEFKNGKINGQGTLTYKDGSKYVGEFKNGIGTQGTFTYADGSKYVGEFKRIDNLEMAFQRNGQGTLTYKDGSKYVGESKDGKRSGQGTATFADGGKYVGEWIYDTRNGKGTETYADGGEYVGEWEYDKKNGQGNLRFSDSSTFVGKFLDDKGVQGVYTHGDGKYVGEWKDGKRTAQGVFTYTNGTKYVGEWKDNEENGQGTATYVDGAKYVGVWEDGKKNGQGTYTWPDGGKYVGEWKDGYKHGKGISTFGDGSTYIGEFKDDERNGQGTYTSKNGSIQKGVYENGIYIAQRKDVIVKNTTNNNTKCMFAENIKKPNLNFFIIDDRKLCICCNARYRRYKLNDLEDLKRSEEVNFLNARLEEHLSKTSADENHQLSDKSNLQAYLALNYGMVGYAGSLLSDALSPLMALLGGVLDLPDPLSRDRKIYRYKIVSDYCSKKCEIYCSR